MLLLNYLCFRKFQLSSFLLHSDDQQHNQHILQYLLCLSLSFYSVQSPSWLFLTNFCCNKRLWSILSIFKPSFRQNVYRTRIFLKTIKIVLALSFLLSNYFSVSSWRKFMWTFTHHFPFLHLKWMRFDLLVSCLSYCLERILSTL